ncbi:MAG: arsenate reductase (glutaredoxin) [Xanthomonadales bacterium]|nr:arsenate reductase (glutaredoxin) [Xanthomonadales bacterium]
MTVRILHNPRCSESRATLSLLQEKGVEPEIIHYLELHPDTKQLAAIALMLGISPHDLLRKGEAEYAELDLANSELDDQQILQAMHNHPRLIERPIVKHKNNAAIGRPPEAVLDIL